MTCSCCKFLNVDAVLETRVFPMLAKYFDNTRYDGVAIRRLVPQSELGDLNQSPDLMLFMEMRNTNYLWCDHVSRYFSRFHWEAVKHECLRLIEAWLDFMIMVNSNVNVIEFFHDKMVKKRLESLSPLTPPRPPNGDFLLSSQYHLPLRCSVQERNDAFFTVARYNRQSAQYQERFELWNLVDRFTIYSDENGVPASSQRNEVVSSILLEPERNRRYVNGIREYASLTYLEYLSPPFTHPTQSLINMQGSALDEWTCTPELLQICDFALGNEGVPLWIPYIPGETCLTSAKHIWCNEYVQVFSLMEALFIWGNCEGVCTIEMRLFESFEELNALGYFPCHYALAYALPFEDPQKAFAETEQFIRENCAADSIEFKPEFELVNLSPSAIVVYKFDFSRAFDL